MIPIASILGVHWRRLLVLSFSVLILAGCGQEPEPELTATSVPVLTPTQAAVQPSPSATPTPAAAPTRTPEGSAATSPNQSTTPALAGEPAQPTATPQATSGLAPSPTPESVAETLSPVIKPLFQLLSPVNGAVTEVGVIRVMGRAEPGSAVAVNGNPVNAVADDSFQYDLLLDEGPNTIEVMATNGEGRTQTPTTEISFVPSEFALPFSLFYPLDGVETDQPKIPVLGASRPDAVVAINGDPVEVTASGIFAGESTLEEGANLVEVVATDIDGNVRFEVIAVFYTP